jgi:uncharacterized protein YktA (UPF0223 family)
MSEEVIMDAKVIIDRNDLHRLDMEWFTEELPKVERRLRAAIGDPYDNPRLRFRDGHREYPLMVTQKMVIPGKTEEHRLSEEFDGFEMLGDKPKSRYVYTNLWGLTLWSPTQTKLVGVRFLSDPDEKMPKEIVDRILDATQKWQEGQVHCSTCGKLIDASEAQNRRHFAGIYCEKCWDKRVKEDANWTS